MTYSILERGHLNSVDYRIFFTDGNAPVSPFHDIPMFADRGKRIYNMVVEVPRWTNAKMEIATEEPLNPIKQDTKDGKLRYVHNCFPHKGYIWNYGAIPQTWDDPGHVDDTTGCRGDNDPIDICEIGHKVANCGAVLQVKILGVMALIDEGETDWKIIAIDVTDPLAGRINDIEDVERYMPGLIRATQEWFQIYKMPAGKPMNKFAFNGEPKGRVFAENVIVQTHSFWQRLIRNHADSNNLSCATMTIRNSPFKIDISEALTFINKTKKHGSALPIDSDVNKWHYVHLK